MTVVLLLLQYFLDEHSVAITIMHAHVEEKQSGGQPQLWYSRSLTLNPQFAESGGGHFM